MKVSRTEYEFAKKPLYWGGGRYVQIKVTLQKKVLNCMVKAQKMKKIKSSKTCTKD